MKKRNIDYRRRAKGTLKGFRLVFNKKASGKPGVGYANIVPDENGVVEGFLYEVDESALDVLDYFEGAPRHYRRKNVEVALEDGRIVVAVTYVANPEYTSENIRPEAEYLEYLLEASDLLSEDYLKILQSIETIYSIEER